MDRGLCRAAGGVAAAVASMKDLSPGNTRLILVLACLAAAILLAWARLVPGAAALGVVTAILGGVLTGSGVNLGGKIASNGKDPKA